MRRAPVLLCLLAGPAAADVTGTWCGDETLHIDATGIGLNEHVICDWDAPPAPLGGSRLALDCRGVHSTGERDAQGREIFHETPAPDPVILTLVPLGPDRLAAQFGTEPTGAVYERCD